MNNKKYYLTQIKKIIKEEPKNNLLSKRAYNGLLNIFQKGSIHDLRTAFDQYNNAKRNGKQIKLLSKLSIRTARKEVRRSQADFLTSINNIEYDKVSNSIPRKERIKNRYNKKNVLNYYNGKLLERIAYDKVLALNYLKNKKIKVFYKRYA